MAKRNLIALSLLLLFAFIGQALSHTPRSGNWKLTKERETTIKLRQFGKILSQMQNEIALLKKKDAIPVGFTYVQLPNEQPPSKIWSGMKWKDVSSDYEGIFFRVEGGNSSAFGQIQEEDSPRLVKSEWDTIDYTSIPSTSKMQTDIPANGQPTPNTFIAPNSIPNTFWRQKLTVSNSEVRPRNMAVRVWRRTK